MRSLKSLMILSCNLCFILAMAQSAWADTTADETYTLAREHYRRGQWKQSIKYFDKLAAESPQTVRGKESLFYKGEALIQIKDYVEAYKAYSAFIDSEPESKHLKRAYFRIGETAYLAKDGEMAYMHLSYFQRTYPDDAFSEYVLPYLGQLELDRNKKEVGIKYFEVALTRYPRGVLADECRFGLAKALLDSNVDDSIRFFEYLVEKGRSPFDANSTMELSRIYMQQDNPKAAMPYLQLMDGKFKSPKSSLETRYMLGRAHLLMGQNQKAIDIFRSSFSAQGNPAFMQAIRYEAAIAAIKLDSIDEANRYLDQLVVRWPDCQFTDKSLFLLARSAFSNKQYKDVVRRTMDFETHASDSEYLIDALDMKAKSLFAMQSYTDSEFEFENLLDLAENDKKTSDEQRSEWHYFVALSRIKADQPEGAVERLNQSLKLTKSPKLIAAIQIAKSNVLLQQENYEEAATSLRSFIAQNQHTTQLPKAAAKLTQVNAHLLRFDEAEQSFELLTQQQVDSDLVAKTVHIVAESAFGAGKFEISNVWFQRLIDPSLPNQWMVKGLSGLGWSYAQMGKSAEAIDAFMKLTTGFPESELSDDATLKMGVLLADQQKLDLAIDAFSMFDDTYTTSDHRPNAILRLAKASRATQTPEHLSAATGAITKLLDEHQNVPQQDALLYELAWLQSSLGKPNQSIESFKQISTDYPESAYWADATYRVAESHLELGDYEQADKMLAQVVQTNGSEIVAHALYLRAKISAESGDWAKSSELMHAFVTRFPKHNLAFMAEYWRAESTYRDNDFELAQTRFETILPKAEARADEHVPKIILRIAQLSATKSDWEKVATLSKDVLNRYPKFAESFEVNYLLGRYHAQIGKMTIAREHYEKALRDPLASGTEISAMARWMIGETYFHQRNFDQAIDVFESVEILHAFPRWQSAALLQAGKCYEQKQDLDAATNTYQRLVNNYPQTMFAGEASKRLEACKHKIGAEIPQNK